MDKVFFLELMATYNAHWEEARKGFAGVELSEGIPKVLFTLQNCEGCVQKQLAKECCIKESTLAVMLKRMETLGFIRKDVLRVSGGKRAYGIFLTKEGKHKAEEVNCLVENIDAKCLEGFSAEEKESFYSYMERVRNNLK